MSTPVASRTAAAIAGVEEIEHVGPCTRCSADHYSHRREGEATGRFAGVIGLRELRP